MATIGPLQVGGKYAPGATLGAYPKSGWLQSQLPPSGAPQGSATATNTVAADTTITITGLTEGVQYFVTDATGAYYVSSTAITAGGGATVGENLAQVGGTAVDTNSGNKSAGTQRVVVATDQPNLTTPLNQNQAQVAGTTVDTNSGVKSAGTQRVVLATDQPALTTPMPVDTELAAAVAASDSIANPTVPQVIAHNMVWDAFNTNWKRAGTPTGGGDGLTGGGFLQAARYLWNGATWDRVRDAVKFVTFSSASITGGTGVTLLTPTSGKKFRLMGWCFSSSAAAQLIFGDNAVGTVIVKSETTAAAGVSKVERFGNGFLSAAANNVLKLDVSATSTVAGFAMYCEE